MRDSTLRMVWFSRILTVFCLQAVSVSTAEDAQHLQTHNSNLKHVPTENLDGHIELSTLDLLPTTAPTQSTHSSHQKKILRHLIKRPIHQNSSSKINRNDALTNRVGFEEKTGDDGFVLTDTSKASFVTSDGGDKHQVIVEKHENDSDGGGISEEKGSGATGSERVGEDISAKVHGSGTAHTRKVLKHINKRLLLTSTTLSLPAPEITTQSHGQKVDRKKQRRTFLENRRRLKPRNPLENIELESQLISTISSLDSILESTSEHPPANGHSITEITKKEQEDSATHVYPEQNDQDILFTQTGPGHDESLFEFTGSTEQDLFDIGGSVEEIHGNPSKRITVTLPKSFSEGDRVSEPTQTSRESSSDSTVAINLNSRFSEGSTRSDDVSIESNSQSASTTESSEDIFDNVNFSPEKSSVSAEILKITTPKDNISTTIVSSTTQREKGNVSNDVPGTVDSFDVPLKSPKQDLQYGSTTETTTSSTEHPDVTVADEAITVVLSSISTEELFNKSTESTTSISHDKLENMFGNSNTISEISPSSTEDPNVTGEVIAMISTRGKVEETINISKERITENDSSIQLSSADSTSTFDMSSTITFLYHTTAQSGITTVASTTTFDSRDYVSVDDDVVDEIHEAIMDSTTENNWNYSSTAIPSRTENPNITITDEAIALVSTSMNTDEILNKSTESTTSISHDNLEHMLDNSNTISEISPGITEDPNVTGEVVAMISTRGKVEETINISKERITENDSSIQLSSADSTSTFDMSSTMTFLYHTTVQSGITTVASTTTFDSRDYVSDDDVLDEIHEATMDSTMGNNRNYSSTAIPSRTENPNITITDDAIALVSTSMNIDEILNRSTETTTALFAEPSQNMFSNVNTILDISVLSSTEIPEVTIIEGVKSVSSITLNNERTTTISSTVSNEIVATHDTLETESDPTTHVSGTNFQLIDHAHETYDAKTAISMNPTSSTIVLHTSATTEEIVTTIPTSVNGFATEEIVTVDPSHWYGIHAGDGVIEVQPGTDISENVTEVFTDEQRSIVNTATHEMPVEDTSIAGTIEQIVTVPPSQWYGINADDGGINEVLNTSEIETSTSVADTTRIELRDRRPVFPEELTVKSKTRSDKALPLDEGIVVEHAILEYKTTTAKLTPTSGVESSEEDKNTSLSFDDQDNLTTTTELIGLRNLISGEIEEAERHKDENIAISNTVVGDVVEHTTPREEVALNTTISIGNTRFTTASELDYSGQSGTGDSDMIVLVQTVPKEKETTDTLPTTKDSFSSTFGGTVTTTEHPTVNSAIPDVKKITSTMEDHSSSVILPNEDYGVTEIITEETLSTDENSIDSTEENVVPSKIYIWTNPDKNISNTVESDVEDISVTTEDHNIEENVKTEQSSVLNQSSTTVVPLLNDSEYTIRYFSNGNYFGNDSVHIVKNISGNPVNVSIQIQIGGESEYIPSDVHVLEDMENQLLNFTWVSASQSFNNSLALRLNQTEHMYMISRVYLNIFKGGAMINLKGDMKNEPRVYKMPQQFNYMIDLNGENKITFSNLNFLMISKDMPNKNIQRGIEQPSKERYVKVGHMEIVIIVIIVIALLLITIYVLLERRRRKTLTKTVANDKGV